MLSTGRPSPLRAATRLLLLRPCGPPSRFRFCRNLPPGTRCSPRGVRRRTVLPPDETGTVASSPDLLSGPAGLPDSGRVSGSLHPGNRIPASLPDTTLLRGFRQSRGPVSAGQVGSGTPGVVLVRRKLLPLSRSALLRVKEEDGPGSGFLRTTSSFFLAIGFSPDCPTQPEPGFPSGPYDGSTPVFPETSVWFPHSGHRKGENRNADLFLSRTLVPAVSAEEPAHDPVRGGMALFLSSAMRPGVGA